MDNSPKKIYMYSLSGNLIEVFPSINQASIKVGVQLSTIAKEVKNGPFVCSDYVLSASSNPPVINHLKKCLACLNTIPIQCFRTSISNSDKLNNYCHSCQKSQPSSKLIVLGNKVCTGCLVDKPRTMFWIANGRKGKPIISSKCKECMKEYQAKRHSGEIEVDESRSRRPAKRKLCLKCLMEKPSSRFRQSSANKDGKNHYCDKCARIYSYADLAILGTKNCQGCGVEKPRIDFKILDKSTSPLCNDCSAKSLSNNPDALREYNAEKKREWRSKNPDRAKAHGANQRANEEYRSKRKEYNQTEKVKRLNKESRKKYSGELRDGYVLKSLMYQTGIPKHDLKKLDAVQHLIKVKRDLLKLKRVIKDKTTKNNTGNGKD